MKYFSPEYNFLKRDYWLGNIDARPLGLFRIAFAALLFKVALYFFFIAEEFFSDSGLTPRSMIWAIVPHNNRFSLMDFLSETWMAQSFFIVWMLISLLLLLGYQTRLMLLLNFIFITSVHVRGFLILNGADLALRVMSFWLLFLPLGETYSLDARWRPHKGTAFALPLRLLQLQIAIVYLFGFLIKLQGKPWRDGTALFYAFQIESHTLPTGDWLLANLPLWSLSLATYFTLVMEAAFIFLVFLPFFQPKLRAIGLLMGIMLHIGIALSMSIHDFSLVMLISYLLFLDPTWFKKRSINPPEKLSLYTILSFALVAMMSLVLWWNLATLRLNKQALVPEVSGMPRVLMQYLGLGQSWSMFAPYPADSSGWMTVPSRFEDGLELDLMTNAPLTENFTLYYWGPETRWKKYSSEVWNTRSGQILQAWAEYYCHRYNETMPNGERLVSFEIVYNWRWSHLPNEELNPLIHSTLWEENCLESN